MVCDPAFGEMTELGSPKAWSCMRGPAPGSGPGQMCGLLGQLPAARPRPEGPHRTGSQNVTQNLGWDFRVPGTLVLDKNVNFQVG